MEMDMVVKQLSQSSCEPQDQALDGLPLGSYVSITEVVPSLSKFRVEFTNDVKTREMRWVLFTSTRRGAIGKLIFTLEKNGTSAHIKSIVVNKEWRGAGLARILYLACLSTLCELQVKELHLEAEEDTRRHGKLVGLYEHWGFAVKPDEKVLYLYNDTECFRKVPMMIPLYTKREALPSPTEAGTWFCMMTLQTPDGTYMVACEDGRIEARKSHKTQDSMWQTLLGRNGEIFLRSVHGKFLCVEESGNILADRPWNSTWETFQVVPHHASSSTDSGGGVALKNFHGGYLCIDPESCQVRTSTVPVPWDSDDGVMGLICNQPHAKPLYNKILRKYHTTVFVKNQLTKYKDCQHASLSMADACKSLLILTGADNTILKFMIASADQVRNDGHPDWLQLAMFLRGLGLLFLLWTDEENEILRSLTWREWLSRITTWAVSDHEPIPSSIEDPELNELNADHCRAMNEKKNASGDISSGLVENVMMPWTPDEYLYTVLQANVTSLPSEALWMIRFWSFRTWYEQHQYEHWCAPQDQEVKDWLQSLQDYHFVREEDVYAVDVDKAMPYYLSLADKYLPPIVRW